MNDVTRRDVFTTGGRPLRSTRVGTLLLTVAAAGTTAITAPLLQSVSAAAAPSARSIPAGYQNWTEHRGNGLHTGVSTEKILSTSTAYRLHWSVNTGDKSYSSPAIVYNATLGYSVVYVGNNDGELNAYNASTGALVWHYQTVKVAGLSKEIELSPAVSNNTVYFGDGDYHEYALNATTGAFICESAEDANDVIASSAVIGDPAGTGDVVYYGNAQGNGKPPGGKMWAMYGVGNTAGPACGSYWYTNDFGNPPGSAGAGTGVYSTPAYATLANGTAVIVCGTTDPDDAIYEFNAKTGAILWRFQTLVGTDLDVGAPATIAEPGTVGASGSASYTDGVVYDTGKDAITYALDLRTGAQLWDFDVKTSIHHGNPMQSGAALVGNYLYIGYGAGVFSLNAATGAYNPAWTLGPAPKKSTTPTTAGVVSSVSVTGPSGSQVIFVGDISGKVYVFSLETGAELYTYSTGALIFSSAGISTGQFFITSSNGDLYAFN